MRPLCSVYVVVSGEVYKRYAWRLVRDLVERWLPGRTEIVILPGATMAGGGGWTWTHVSATRYRVALENRARLRGEYVFQLDADMRVLRPVGEEVLGDGLTVTVHPGFPPESDPATWPYERSTRSCAYVPFGSEGGAYHPGALVGGRRETFFDLAERIALGVDIDLSVGVRTRWYEESHLNRILAYDRPAGLLVLDRRYCWWQQWGESEEAVVMHLDKTAAELAERG
jgi:hypothetical protein